MLASNRIIIPNNHNINLCSNNPGTLWLWQDNNNTISSLSIRSNRITQLSSLIKDHLSTLASRNIRVSNQEIRCPLAKRPNSRGRSNSLAFQVNREVFPGRPISFQGNITLPVEGLACLSLVELLRRCPGPVPCSPALQWELAPASWQLRLLPVAWETAWARASPPWATV
jgi:hypothetical protein